jgi:hypothetical protein
LIRIRIRIEGIFPLPAKKARLPLKAEARQAISLRRPEARFLGF